MAGSQIESSLDGWSIAKVASFLVSRRAVSTCGRATTSGEPVSARAETRRPQARLESDRRSSTTGTGGAR